MENLLAQKPHRLRNDLMQLNLKYDDRGLIPAIVQESSESGGRVLMMAWMNEDSLHHSVESGYMHYWSRSRKKLWKKGESSGHTQKILRWFVDCDRDTLLFEVEQHGGACHTGFASCFYVELDGQGNDLPPQEEPLFNPESVYKA
jgi:phosphoribosyl-AMP cyclohydrolase